MSYGYTVGSTSRVLPCGCSVVGARDDTDATPEMGVGTIPNPWTVKHCEAHAAVRFAGPLPECARCGKRKAPRGRSIPLPAHGGYCTDEPDGCAGYREDPQSTFHWPGEAYL